METKIHTRALVHAHTHTQRHTYQGFALMPILCCSKSHRASRLGDYSLKAEPFLFMHKNKWSQKNPLICLKSHSLGRPVLSFTDSPSAVAGVTNGYMYVDTWYVHIYICVCVCIVDGIGVCIPYPYVHVYMHTWIVCKCSSVHCEHMYIHIKHT